MFPPRTGINPRMEWNFAGTTEPQKLSNHEYFEFRYVTVEFPNAEVPPSSISCVPWVVRAKYDEASQTLINTSSTELNNVWEMCRYTIEASSLDLYSDSNARQRSADCIADDVTAMQSQYTTTSELTLQLYALQQMIFETPASRTDWQILHKISATSGLVEGAMCLVDWPTNMMDRFVRSDTSTVASGWVHYGIITLSKLARFLNRSHDADNFDMLALNLSTAM
eukprot:UC4_evm1s20